MRPPTALPFRIAMRYRDNSLKGYAMGKLLSDPVYQAVYERIRGTGLAVLDLGCGPGLCAFYLRGRGYRGPILGIDSDARKVRAARRVVDADRHRDRPGPSDAPAPRFCVADIADPAVFHRFYAPPDPSACPGHVVLLDVLHYFDPAAQRAVLGRVIGAVAPGGWAILRVTPRDGSWRYRVTRVEEWAIGRIGWMSSPARHFPEAAEVTAPFEAAGFEPRVTPLWGRTPFNSYLFAFRRPR